MKPIVFVGSNNNLLQMVDNANSTGREVVGIVDSDYYGNTDSIEGVPVIASEDTFAWDTKFDYFVATSWFPENTSTQQRNKTKRLQLISILEKNKIVCTNLVHARALVPKTCELGNGVMIAADAILGNYAMVGNYSQIREKAYLAHHACVEQDCIVQVGCYVGSSVVVGAGSYMGIGASIVPSHTDPLVIERNSFIKSMQLITSNTKTNKVKNNGQ
jgi:carbonic anhydrase/acetyltransferase-like protein (isoleucine patch superfamily)